MRLQLTITDLDAESWSYLQSVVRTEYEIPAEASRVCLTFTHEGEERHAEMPLGALVGLLLGLGMAGVSRDLQRALSKLRTIDLPSFLNQVRREADPALKKTQEDSDAADLLDEISEYPSAEGWPNK